MKSIRKSLAEVLTVLLVIGMLPVSPGRIVTSAATNDTATESDALGDGLVAETEKTDVLPASKGTDSDAAFDQTVTVSGYTIRVTAEAGVFPEGSTLFAEEITDTGKKETINEKVSEEAGKETAALISFDIKVLDQSGNEAEPDLTKGKPVVTFGKVNAEKLTGQSDAKLEVYHLDNDLNNAEKLKAEENKTTETVKAEAEHFSVFTVAMLSGAGGTQTGTWKLEDYERSTDSDAKVITLNNYTGSDTELYVPGSVTVDGTEYTIALKVAGASWKNGIWYGKHDNITSLSFGSGIKLPNDCYYMFSELSSLTNLDVSKFDTSKVTYMDGMFEGCSSLTSLDVSKFDTSYVKQMSQMFGGCSSLTSLDLSNFNTTKVYNMESMFAWCQALSHLDVSNFSTSNVKYIDIMFSHCDALQNLDLRNFDLSGLPYYTSGALFDSSSLKSLWVPKNVKDGSYLILPDSFYKVNSDGTIDKSQLYTLLPTGFTESFQIAVAPIGTNTVTFESNGGSDVASLEVPYGSTVTGPTDPTKTGYVFNGWYKNSYMTIPWDFNTAVTYPITLYAKWTVDPEVTINYVSADTSKGTVDPSSETIFQTMGVASGSDATALTGYHFVSWTDAAGAVVSTDSKFTPAKVNNLNVAGTYTANFALDTYTVSFNTNGHGTTPADESVDYGYTVTEPAAPSESGYTFGGWYKEAACTSAWDFASDLVSGDMTLYAKWTKNTTGSTSSSESSNSTSYTGQWVKNSIGWWYKNTDGTWPSNEWKQINGKWYHFNEKGYMQTGWILDNEKWYYLDPDTGAMVTGLLKAPDGYWYYFRTDGSMAVGDVTVDGTQRHFNDQVPPEPTYVSDPEKGTWVPNGSNAIPYGAEIK